VELTNLILDIEQHGRERPQLLVRVAAVLDRSPELIIGGVRLVIRLTSSLREGDLRVN
jgi:hypothetical protein